MDGNNIFIVILNLFSPETIYAQLDGAMDIYMYAIAPAIILLSIATRYVELMVENIGQGARWMDAVKDVKTAIIFTGLYTSLGAVAIKFHQAFCAFMYEHGSISVILDNYQQFIESLKTEQTEGFFEKLASKVSQYSIQSVVTQTLCFISMILLALVNVLLRIIYALGFCLLYLWGMFAVPTMASRQFKLNSGWFRGVITLAIWPVIEATTYMLVGPMFESWAQNVSDVQFLEVGDQITGLALIYTFANLVLVALSIGAFFLAVVISMNQNFMAGLGTSVLAAWGAGTSLAMNATRLVKSTLGGVGAMRSSSGGDSGVPTGSGGESRSVDGLSGNSGPSPAFAAAGGNSGGTQTQTGVSSAGQSGSIGGVKSTITEQSAAGVKTVSGGTAAAGGRGPVTGSGPKADPGGNGGRAGISGIENTAKNSQTTGIEPVGPGAASTPDASTDSAGLNDLKG